MSSESIRNRCPPTCPTVKKQIRAAIAEAPWLLDEIFPRKKNDVNSRVPSDIIPKDTRDEPERVIEADVLKAAVDDHEKIETVVPPKILEDIITVRPIQEQIVAREVKIVEEPVVVPAKKITDRDDEKVVIPTEKITDRDNKKIDLAEEREVVQEIDIKREPTIILTKKKNYNGEKIDLVEEKELVQEAAIIQEPTVTPTEKIVDRDDKKIDLAEAKELVEEAAIIQEPTVTPMEKIVDDKKIDLIEEKEVPVAIKKVVENEIEKAVPTEIDLEPSVEAEEYFELEKRVKPDEEEETLTDYEKFIDEELQEALPAVIAKEIPEEPRKVRREISKDAATLYDRIDRERAVRPPRERDATTAIPKGRDEINAPANSTRAKRIVSRRAAEDACDETCPLVKEQKGEQLAYFYERKRQREKRIARKLKEQQRIIEHYYLTKGFSYFEDVCTCSLACMMYTLSRDPFVRSIFASLALFAVGLKLCSELDAWEMPSRVS